MENAIVKNNKATVLMTQAEYENMRIVAWKKKEKFLVNYSKEGIKFTANIVFLATTGFLDF